MADESPLEARVARLERRTARLAAIAAMLALALALTIARFFVPQPALDASRFMLRDSIGTWRGALMLREDGSPVLRLNDARSRARFYAVVTPDGRPRVRLLDSTTTTRGVLELEADGSAALRLTDSAGHTAVRAGVDSTGSGWAELHGRAGSRFETNGTPARARR
ncbi:MAG: hypothetical protein U0704_14130 [Candidatus Eisenbacteria bacterium]